MSEERTVSYESAVGAALDAALVVEDAYVSVLAVRGVAEEDILEIQNDVRAVIAVWVGQ